MEADALLVGTDIEEALSVAYVQAIAAAAGYAVSKTDFDRDGVDITFSAGGDLRPKLDAQLKATINLGQQKGGVLRYPCPKRNYDLLRVATQTPRILIVLDLPRQNGEWITVSADELVLRRCAFWTCLRDYPETDNKTTITVDLPEKNRFDVAALKNLMQQSRSGKIVP